MLPNEGTLILESLIQKNSHGSKIESPKKGHAQKEGNIDPKEFVGKGLKEFRLESQFETYLLQNQGELNSLTQFINDKSTYYVDLYNQVSTYIAGGAVDIIAVYEKYLFDMWLKLGVGVFEIKKGVLEPDTIEQLIEYIEWSSRIFPGIKKDMIQGVAIGRDFGNLESCKKIIAKIEEYDQVYNLICYTYSVSDNNNIIFNRII